MAAATSGENGGRDRALHWLWRIAVGLFSVAAVLFFLDAFKGLDFSEVGRWNGRVDWLVAALSLVIGLAHVVAACSMILLLLPRVSRPGMLAVLLMSQIAKYVPGKVWGVVMQKVLASSSVSTVRLASANLIGMMLVVLAQVAVLVFAVCWRWAGPVSAVIAVLLFAAFLLLALMLAVRFAGRIPRLSWLAEQDPRCCLRLMLAWLITTASLIASWATFFSGALGLDAQLSLDSLMLTTAAFIAGLASILPAGIGVREGAFLLLGEGGGVASAGVVIGLAVLTRIYLLALDALAVLSGLVLHASQRGLR